MRLLLLATIASVIGATTTYAGSYRTTQYACYELLIPSDTLSTDSLQLLYNYIDLLTVFDLNKWRESYIYKNRREPSYQNKQILIYIEERLKITK